MNDPEEFPVSEREEDEQRQELYRLLQENKVVQFDWGNKRMKGEEYYYILSNIDLYCQALSLQKFQPKTHPECIYIEPESKRARTHHLRRHDLLRARQLHRL